MGRLFWKIFLWFLVASMMLSALLYALTLHHLSERSPHTRIIERVIQQRVEAVSTIVRYGGKAALQDYLQRSGDVRPRIWVLDINDEDVLGRRVPPLILALGADRVMTRSVETMMGQQYMLRVYVPSDGLKERLGARVAQFRQQLPGGQRLIVFVLFSVLACAWLAWYLTRPVRVLSEAARALAQGQLDGAITPRLGSRRDELVSLAEDFDTMADALQARQQAFQQLLNDISHELRSPLTRIRLKFGLLEKQQMKIGVSDSQLISQELDRLGELIDQVLTLARLDAKHHYKQEDFIDLPQLIGVICQHVELEAGVKQCRIESLLPEKEIVIAANGELLRRAFENIVRNAVSHSPAGSAVRVSCQQEQGTLVIRVLDQGCGVNEEELADIFSPFVRLDSARPRGGYGLGLAIAQRAVLRHGGSISAHNAEGAGLLVEIVLPTQSEKV